MRSTTFPQGQSTAGAVTKTQIHNITVSGRKEVVIMTEYELFVSCIPMIAEIIAECQRMPVQQYEEWKQKTLEAAPDQVRKLMEKVFIVIDSFVQKEEAASQAH